MGVRAVDKGSGTADLCTQASDDSSGCPTANTAPVDLTARADNNNKTEQLSLQAATLSSEQHHTHRNGAAWALSGEELRELGRHKLPDVGSCVDSRERELCRPETF